jgi:thiosulfate/3-mercaptopyruvate sulfurtransferase
MPYTTIIDATHAREHLADPAWVFVDCRFDIRDRAWGRREYRVSHVAGAVFADLDRDLSGAAVPGKTGRHPLPEPAALVAVFSLWGIEKGTQVVAYDESTGAMAAARLWWLLRWAGHDAVAVLDGGLKAWTQAGFPCRAGEESRAAARFVPAFRNEMTVDVEGVQAARADGAWVIVDARSADRFRGENESIDPVAGHIPGAVSCPYAAALEPGGRLKEPTEIARVYRGAMGGRDSGHTIVYCGSGVTAAHAVLACSHAGLGAPRLYAGSWSEWITDANRPVASH